MCAHNAILAHAKAAKLYNEVYKYANPDAPPGKISLAVNANFAFPRSVPVDQVDEDLQAILVNDRATIKTLDRNFSASHSSKKGKAVVSSEPGKEIGKLSAQTQEALDSLRIGPDGKVRPGESKTTGLVFPPHGEQPKFIRYKLKRDGPIVISADTTGSIVDGDVVESVSDRAIEKDHDEEGKKEVEATKETEEKEEKEKKDKKANMPQKAQKSSSKPYDKAASLAEGRKKFKQAARKSPKTYGLFSLRDTPPTNTVIYSENHETGRRDPAESTVRMHNEMFGRIPDRAVFPSDHPHTGTSGRGPQRTRDLSPEEIFRGNRRRTFDTLSSSSPSHLNYVVRKLYANKVDEEMGGKAEDLLSQMSHKLRPNCSSKSRAARRAEAGVEESEVNGDEEYDYCDVYKNAALADEHEADDANDTRDVDNKKVEKKASKNMKKSADETASRPSAAISEPTKSRAHDVSHVFPALVVAKPPKDHRTRDFLQQYVEDRRSST